MRVEKTVAKSGNDAFLVKVGREELLFIYESLVTEYKALRPHRENRSTHDRVKNMVRAIAPFIQNKAPTHG